MSLISSNNLYFARCKPHTPKKMKEKAEKVLAELYIVLPICLMYINVSVTKSFQFKGHIIILTACINVKYKMQSSCWVV